MTNKLGYYGCQKCSRPLSLEETITLPDGDTLCYGCAGMPPKLSERETIRKRFDEAWFVGHSKKVDKLTKSLALLSASNAFSDMEKYAISLEPKSL